MHARGKHPSRWRSQVRQYFRYTTRSGARWLLPRERRQRAAGIAMYVPYNLGGHARKALMLLGAAGTVVDSTHEEICELEPRAKEALARDDVTFAWYLGARRSESKTSALAIDPDGRPVAFLKVATTPTARRSLEREWRMLRVLDASFEGAAPAPRPLGWHTHEEAWILVTSTAPSRPGPVSFGPLHTRFLAVLAERHQDHQPFTASQPWHQVSGFLDEALFRRASDDWRARFEHGIEHLEQTLGDAVITTTLAHRDFAPWNTRRGRSGLMAFDWEYAATGYPLNHDFFHYAFMVALLLRRGASLDDARRWLRNAPIRDARNPHFLVAYLLDLARQYHGFHHDSDDTPDDPILRQAARLLDGASRWLDG